MRVLTSVLKGGTWRAALLALALVGGSAGAAEAQTTITRRVAASTDDAEEEGPTGTTPNRMWLASTDIELVSDFEPNTAGVQKVGFRFTNMTVPAGAIVTDAYLIFRAIAADPGMTNSDATSLTIKGELAANASTFTTTSGDISGRTLTSASASWVPTPWTTGTDYNSPSIVSGIQELVNQGTWTSGNAMAIIITGTGHRASPSWDGDASNAAQLVVTYTLPPRTWTGGGTDNNWSTAANWDTGVPAAGDDLVFPSGAARLGNTNNLTAGTSFNSITISGNGYTLGGNSIVLGSLSDINTTGANAITLPISLTGARAFSIANAAETLTISGAISGAGGPALSGSGTLTLSGNNSYTGVTTIASGSTLIAAANNALGTTAGATTINSGGTLGFQGGITYSTLEPVTVNGAGVGAAGAILNLSGSNSFAGTLTIGSASTFGSSAGGLTISDAFSNAGFLLTATGAGSLTFSGAISGAGGLTKNGSGTLTLSGGSDNTFSGVTTVNDGVVALNKTAGKDAYRGTLTVGDGTGSANSAVVRWLASNQVPKEMITVNSDGLVDLNGFSNTVDGLTMTGGNVTTGAGALTLDNTVTTNVAATSATISGNLVLGGDRIFSVADGAAAEDLVVSAVVSGDNKVTKQGAGLMTFSGTNTYQKVTTISAGTLSVATIGNGGVAGNLGAAPVNASNLVLEGGTLQYTGSTASTNRNFTLDDGTASAIEITTVGTTLTISGASVNKSGALTKLGSGTLALSGTNLHTGTTAINAGTLLVNGSLSITSPVSLNGGTLGGSGSVGAVTSTALGGALSTGNPDTSPGIFNSGNVNLSAAGTRSLVVQLNGTTAGTNYDQLNVTGTVNLTGATLTGTLGFAAAGGSTFTIINNDNTDAVAGTFAGLAEGATVTLGGSNFTISYTGGTSNDVVLTRSVSVSGNVFEDVNYGGGAGRSKAASSGVSRSGARVELYTSAGVYSTFTTTDVNGDYSFANFSAGTYYIRVVNSSVTSSRTGYTSAALPVQTYRTDATSGSAAAVTDHVGGTNPSVADPGNGSAGATFSTTTFVYSAVLSGTAQSVTKAVVASTDISGLDFGLNFNAVVNVNNTGQGSLRQFIDNANLLGGDASLAQAGLIAAKDNAVFMISNGTSAAGLRSTNNYFSGGVATISPTSGLSYISTTMVLDAQKQPGWSSAPIIELNGSGAGAGVDGLTVSGGGTIVRGFVINRFTNHGIYLITAGADTVQGNYVGTNSAGTAASANTVHGIFVYNIAGNFIGGTSATARNVVSGNNYGVVIAGASATGNTVSGNYVGLNAAGTAAIPNSIGIDVEAAASGNTIGGTSSSARNIVSGNTQMGVLLQNSGTTGNTVAGNYIGTNTAGTAAVANGTFGVNIKSSASGNTIGGTTGTAGNIISGNTASGIAIEGAAASGNIVQGNYVGLDPAGTAAIANGSHGIYLNGAPTNTVGGTTAAARNVVSGNSGSGIYLFAAGASGNVIRGNYIGTNATGTAAVANAVNGVLVEAAVNDTIGGTAVGAGNVISGNTNHGLWLYSTTSGIQVQGNRIGTNAAGTSAIPNVVHGLTISGGASSNTIGGTGAAARNIISGNTVAGVRLLGATTTGNVIQGNYIGVDSTGTAALGNGTFGVFVDATNTTLGGTAAGAGNLIANNGSDGVAVVNTSTGNAIERNAVYANGGLGIDLADDGVTLNNGTQNGALPNSDMDFPVFTSAFLNGTTLTVAGYVGSAPSQATFASARVELFKSDNDASTYGEGQNYLGFLTADGSGNFSGSLVVSGLAGGDKISGTATDGSGNSSEFGANVTVGATLSGTVFEDVNYGGGAGRTLAASSGAVRSAARVELYTSAGVYSTFTTTDGSGNYSFTGLAAGTYYLRVVNSSVTSSRTGYTSAALPVQSYRTDATSGTAAAVTDFVGGTNPSVADPGNGSAGATFSTTTFVYSAMLSGTAQSVAPAVISSANITGLDFGFNFNTVVNVNNTGQGSLRQFIENANLLSNTGLAQSGRTAGIDNAIWMISNGTAAPGLRSSNSYFSGGVATIAPTSVLPTATDPIVLDAQTQPGWTSSPIVELNGTSVAASNSGLAITAGGSTVRGFIINRFAASTSHAAIAISGAGSNTVQGNYLGTDAAGTSSSQNYQGVRIDGVTGNLIGGTTTAQRNVISGNQWRGVYLVNGASGNTIRGNYIGVDASGAAALPNQDIGVYLDQSGTNTVGGTGASEGNVISGNTQYGIYFVFPAASSNIIQGNTIGLNAARSAALANGTSGIEICCTGNPPATNTVGGAAAGAGNIISGNTSYGIRIWDGTSNTIQANTISANGLDGIQIRAGTGNGIVANSIYGNGTLGIDLGNNDAVTPNNGTKNGALPNSDMDYPVFTGPTPSLSGTTLSLSGYVGSAPSQATFAGARVEVFKSDNDASGNGEGQTYLGFLTADGSGNFTGTLTVSGLAVGDKITGTATDGSNSTSEFSLSTTVSAPPPILALGAAVSPTGTQPPGTDLAYTISFSNTGGSAATGVVIIDSLKTNVDFKLASATSNLGTTGLSVVVAYSNNGGTTFVYTPVSGGGGAPAGYDRTVTHVRWSFTGNLSQTAPNNAASVGLTSRIR